MSYFKDKIILVTGGTGTIGAAIVQEVLKHEPKQVRILSRNDSSQYHLMDRLNHPHNVRMLIGDVRDRDRLMLAFENVNIVFHAAALKHVPLCEYNPQEAVKTNVLGSQNVIDAAFVNKVEKVIAISTDKAVDPNNIMGATKLMMEKLFINTAYYSKGKSILSCVRFGNVAWANGSVFALWGQQIKQHGRISVTNPRMTRFIMSVEQAIRLTLRAAALSQGGEIFIFKMPAVRLGDLARLFLQKYHPGEKIGIKIIGARPGEKTDEELFSVNDRARQILEDRDMFVLIPEIHFTEAAAIPAYHGFRRVRRLKGYSAKGSLNLKRASAIINSLPAL